MTFQCQVKENTQINTYLNTIKNACAPQFLFTLYSRKNKKVKFQLLLHEVSNEQNKIDSNSASKCLEF